MRGFFGAEDRHRNACFPQCIAEALRLCGRVGMLRDVQDQKRRDALVPGHMRDGGEVAMFLPIVCLLYTSDAADE